MSKLLLSLAALSLLTACEAAAPPAGAATPAAAKGAENKGHFVIRAPGSALVEVLIEDGNITGPEVSVTRFQTPTDHALRGTAFGVPVDVAIVDKTAKGLLGSGPLELSTERREGKIHVSGLVGGTISDFEVNMKILKGRIGQCHYDLDWNGNAYQGSRSCGTSAEPVTVSVPTTLGKWSDAELGACLGLLMSRPPNAQMAGVKMRTNNPNQPIDQAGAKPSVGPGRAY